MIFVAKTDDGDDVRWKDSKRYLWLLSVLAPTLPAQAALLIVFSGEPIWSFAPLIIYYGVIPLLDLIVGETEANPPDEVIEQLSSDNWYRILLHLAVIGMWLGLVITAYVFATVAMPIWAMAALAVSAGVASGSALTVGHELGHKPGTLERLGAKFACALNGYGHFNIEHNRGHHTQVATPDDVASAKMGENVWAFALREIPGAAVRGWRHEADRLARKKLPFWHWRNDILQGYAISLIAAIALTLWLGPVILLFLFAHHLVGWFMLTLANYVEHYGLLRARKPNGKYVQCEPKHSWNTNHIVSNLFLFHLQRHSDHHANPAMPYQALRNFENLPQLPSGYPGCFLLAIIPPLWFRVMDPKVMAWAGGNPENTNLTPYKAKQLGLALNT